MGPFPHDAPQSRSHRKKKKPAGTDGFEFVECRHPETRRKVALNLFAKGLGL